MFSITHDRTRPTHVYWGPAQHDEDHPLHPAAATFDPFDQRDDAAERPDDN
jgi:hypothetical protein